MTSFDCVAVLIPAYRPCSALVSLGTKLIELLPGVRLLIVRDGVFGEDEPVFSALKGLTGVEIITHAVNLGKGRALKSGMNWILVNRPEVRCLVTADADGQHLPSDIKRVAEKTLDSDGIVLGSRFSVLSTS